MKYKILAILCVCIILWFTILPVEQYWCKTDIRFTEVICGVSIVAVLMLVWRKQRVTISAIDIIIALWLAYVIFRSYVDTTYPCANYILHVMQMMALYVCLRVLFSSVLISEKIIVFIVLICASYEVILGAGQMINGDSRHYLFPMTGSFLNPGPYSIFLSMGLVMSCKMKKEYYTGKGILPSMMSWFPIVFLILLPATWSRAALLSAAICLGVIYWEQWKRWRWCFFAGVVAVMAVLYYLKQGSADGRTIIYMISLLSICHAPVFGSGIGSFCHQYAEGMANFSIQHPTFNFLCADVVKGAFNCILQIGVEQGIVGVCFAVALVVLMFVDLGKFGKSLGMGVLCLLIFSMFSYPFDQLPYQIIFVLIAAYAATGKTAVVPFVEWHQLSQKYFAPIITLGCIVLLSVFIHRQIMERVKVESEYKMIVGQRNAVFLGDYYKFCPLLLSNEKFLFDFSKILSRNGRYIDSNAMLRLGTFISNDPMFYVVNVMPNRLYPLYKLMLLYEKEGNADKEIQMAQRVLTFKEKVVSPATKEMKKRASEVYESLTTKNKEVAENL